jgi:hypothetical protein
LSDPSDRIAGVKHRKAVLVLAAVVVAVAFYVALGPPRVLWLNAGLEIAHEWTHGAAAVLAAAAAAGMAAVVKNRAGQVVAVLGALALGVFAVQRLTYRVDAVQDSLSLRTVLGTTRIPWSAVTRMDAAPTHLTAVSTTGAIRIGTAGLSADERAALERTVARRIREADGSRPRPLAGSATSPQ